METLKFEQRYEVKELSMRLSGEKVGQRENS